MVPSRLPTAGLLESAPKLLLCADYGSGVVITSLRLVNTSDTIAQVWLEYAPASSDGGPGGNERFVPLEPWPIILPPGMMGEDGSRLRLGPGDLIRGWADGDGKVSYLILGD